MNPDQSAPMQWDEQVFTDRDGYQTRPRVGDRDLCLTCGMPCTHVFDGLSFHPEHWVESTVAEREQRWRRVEQWMLAHPEDYVARLEGLSQTASSSSNAASGPQPSTASRRAITCRAGHAGAASRTATAPGQSYGEMLCACARLRPVK